MGREGRLRIPVSFQLFLHPLERVRERPQLVIQLQNLLRKGVVILYPEIIGQLQKSCFSGGVLLLQ